LSLSLLLLSSLSFFFSRACDYARCKGPLAIGMKVGSCVEMESPGPRLYTHLPTRADDQDRVRGPRSSSPIELPGGAPLLLFSSPFLDSLLTLSLSLSCTLSLFLPPTPLLVFLPLFLSLFLSRSLLPFLDLLADFFAPFCSGPRLCPALHARFIEMIFANGFITRLVLC